ncbi:MULTISPECIES: DUF6894 family protein [Bradyrhizobium]|jgi:hypothetical protein|nr:MULTISPECIES: hypothetical protein [Bradyrhizobium]
MPKYFFDHHSNTSIEIDDEGIDLPDVDAAEGWRLRHWANRCWMARLVL